MLHQLYHKGKARHGHSGPPSESCAHKQCNTNVSWHVKGTWVRLNVRRELGDIWKIDALSNPKWLAQVAEPSAPEVLKDCLPGAMDSSDPGSIQW